MASGERNNGDVHGLCNVGDTNFDYTDMEASLKLEKSSAKSTLTRLKNKLMFSMETEDIRTSREVQEACENMDNGLEKALDVMTRLSRLYMENKEKEKGIKVALESDKLEEDHNAAYEIARHNRRLLKGKKSSEKSENLAIHMLNRMNIADSSGTFQKQRSFGFQEQLKEIGYFNSRDERHGLESMKDTKLLSCLEEATQKQGLAQESEKMAK